MNRIDFLQLLGISGIGALSGFVQESERGVETIIKPGRLAENATIGLISPGSIIPEEGRYEEIKKTIRELGFRVKEGAHARNRYGYLAGSDKARAADINSMFKDPEVDAIIPYRGGWGSNRILDLIDFELIRKNPKALIGFSDITSLLLAIYTKTGLITFHGPVGKSEWNQFTVKNFRSILMKSSPPVLKTPRGEDTRVISPGTASGRLLGGNLTVLTSMLGSTFLPDFDGSILFLEDIGEDVYRIDRMITQLKMSGILDSINGLIFGKCTDCNPGTPYSHTLDEVLNDHIVPLRIPAFRGAMIGHIEKMLTLPIGIPAEMDTGKRQIKVLETSVI